MQSVFITGGSGFLGRALIARLRETGTTIRAMARSPRSAEDLTAIGAESVSGGLDNVSVMAAGMRGCDVVFHIAGHLSDWDDYAVFYEANVVGTRNVLAAAQAAGVPILVAAGASAVVMGRPRKMLGVGEDLPLQAPSWGPYIATKAEAEQLVRAANASSLRTVVIRPPLIWGKGMPMLNEMVAAANSGQFALPDGGRQRMSTAHVENVVECLILAAHRGHGGAVYNVTDGSDTKLSKVLNELLETRGIAPITRSVPFAIAWRIAGLLEMVWRPLSLPGKPPITRQTLRMIGQDFTLKIEKAQRELGYRPVIDWESGIATMLKGPAVFA